MSKIGLTPFEIEQNNRLQNYKTFRENREKKWSKVFNKYKKYTTPLKDFPRPSRLFLGEDLLFLRKFGNEFETNPKATEFLDNLEMWDNPYEYHIAPEEYEPHTLSHTRSIYYQSIYGYEKFNA